MELLRCCRNEIHRHAARTNCELPAEGTTLECSYCLMQLVWFAGAWTTVIHKQASPEATAIRHTEADRVTGGKFSRYVQRMEADAARKR